MKSKSKIGFLDLNKHRYTVFVYLCGWKFEVSLRAYFNYVRLLITDTLVQPIEYPPISNQHKLGSSEFPSAKAGLEQNAAARHFSWERVFGGSGVDLVGVIFGVAHPDAESGSGAEESS